MNSFKGWLLDQFNRPVNKLVGLLPVGARAEGRFRQIWKYYFGDSERFYTRREGTYELHCENEAYQAMGGNRMFYVNANTGEPVGFGVTGGVTFKPEELKEMFDTSDINCAVKAAKRSELNWMWILIGAVVGGAVVFAVYPFIPLPGA